VIRGTKRVMNEKLAKGIRRLARHQVKERNLQERTTYRPVDRPHTHRPYKIRQLIVEPLCFRGVYREMKKHEYTN